MSLEHQQCSKWAMQLQATSKFAGVGHFICWVRTAETACILSLLSLVRLIIFASLACRLRPPYALCLNLTASMSRSARRVLRIRPMRLFGTPSMQMHVHVSMTERYGSCDCVVSVKVLHMADVLRNLSMGNGWCIKISRPLQACPWNQESGAVTRDPAVT